MVNQTPLTLLTPVRLDKYEKLNEFIWAEDETYEEIKKELFLSLKKIMYFLMKNDHQNI